MIRIYADFNSQDEQGRVVLNTVGSLLDIERYKDLLAEGSRVTLYMSDAEVLGTLVIDEGTWKAVPD